ncbi:MAG: hypothetical protein GY793_03400 [Proteobacteria bacterium]|nr:hypothetical protein [Pseudomonadota bacterium]
MNLKFISWKWKICYTKKILNRFLEYGSLESDKKRYIVIFILMARVAKKQRLGT